MPNMQEILSAPRDLFNVSRVFGDPIEKGSVTVVPVATVAGGGGGGKGQDATETETGEGGRFGGMARAAGVYVIHDDEVTWQPALDVTRISVMAMLLAGLMTVVIGSAIKRHERR